MDDHSSETKEEEVIDEGIGESEMMEWGWRRNKGSRFQKRGKAYQKERSVILREDDVGGRARVTTHEKRVLRGHWTQIRLWREVG